MPPRIYLPAERLSAERIILPPDVLHYLCHVLRMQPEEIFIVFDGQGTEYRVALRAEQGQFYGQILEAISRPMAPRLRLTLYQGLPKGKKLPLIIQKITELGVMRLVPVQTARSAVRLAGRQEGEKKLQRWQKIADEAARQCGRTQGLEIAPVLSWEQALEDWRRLGQPGIMPDETLAGQEGHSLRETLAGLSSWEALSVFIGPEGGFAPYEAASGREAGLLPVSLGPHVLRTETAAIVICALLLYEAGDLG